MDDLTLTRLCAEAMGLSVSLTYGRWGLDDELAFYDPLHDDAQAMALVKRFRLESLWNEMDDKDPAHQKWHVWPQSGTARGWNADLNRAIVECVAKLQASHTTESRPVDSLDNATAK